MALTSRLQHQQRQQQQQQQQHRVQRQHLPSGDTDSRTDPATDSPTSTTTATMPARPAVLAKSKSKRRIFGPYPRKNKDVPESASVVANGSNSNSNHTTDASSNSSSTTARQDGRTVSRPAHARPEPSTLSASAGAAAAAAKPARNSDNKPSVPTSSVAPAVAPVARSLRSNAYTRRSSLDLNVGRRNNNNNNNNDSTRSTGRTKPTVADQSTTVAERRASSHHNRLPPFGNPPPETPSQQSLSFSLASPSATASATGRNTNRVRSIAIEGFHDSHTAIPNSHILTPVDSRLDSHATPNAATTAATTKTTATANHSAAPDSTAAVAPSSSLHADRSKTGSRRCLSPSTPSPSRRSKRSSSQSKPTRAPRTPNSDRRRLKGAPISALPLSPSTPASNPPPVPADMTSPATISRRMAKPSLVKARLQEEKRRRQKIRQREKEAKERMQKIRQEIQLIQQREKQQGLEQELKELQRVSELAALGRMTDDMDSDVYSTDDDDVFTGLGTLSGHRRANQDTTSPKRDRVVRQNSRKVISQMNSSFAMLNFDDSETDEGDDELHEDADEIDYDSLVDNIIQASPQLRATFKVSGKNLPSVPLAFENDQDDASPSSNRQTKDDTHADADDEQDSSRAGASGNGCKSSQPRVRPSARRQRSARKKPPQRNLSNLVPEMRRRISQKDIMFDDDDRKNHTSIDDDDDDVSAHSHGDSDDSKSKSSSNDVTRSTYGNLGRATTSDSIQSEPAPTSKSARAFRASTSSIETKDRKSSTPSSSTSPHKPDTVDRSSSEPAIRSVGRLGGKMYSSSVKNGGKDKNDNQGIIEQREKLEKAKADFQRGHDLCWKFQDSASALMEFRKALFVRESLLGKFHEDTGRSYYWIGRSLVKLQEFEEALVAFSRALRIFERVLMKTHKYVKWTRSAIDTVFKEMDQDSDVLHEYKRAVEDSIEYERVGDSYRKKGKLTEAIAQYRNAIDNIEEYHPDAADLYCKIAIIFRRQGEFERALDEYRFASEIYELSLGADHPETVKALNNLIEKRRLGQVSMAIMQQLNSQGIS